MLQEQRETRSRRYRNFDMTPECPLLTRGDRDPYRSLKWPHRLIALALVGIGLLSPALADEARRSSTADLIATLQPSVVNIAIVRHTKIAAPAANIAGYYGHLL